MFVKIHHAVLSKYSYIQRFCRFDAPYTGLWALQQQKKITETGSGILTNPNTSARRFVVTVKFT
jgi:hypothetical protein